MLLVETYLDISPGKGIGLFAKINIKKGTKYWVRNEVFDKVFSLAELETFNQLTTEYIKFYGFQEKTFCWYLCGDNGRFTNHSSTPNTKNHFDKAGILQYSTVTKNVGIGEEILCDYQDICMTCKNELLFKIY